MAEAAAAKEEGEGGRDAGRQVEHIDSPDGGGGGGEDVGGDSGPVGARGAMAMVSPPARRATCVCSGSEREGNIAGGRTGGRQALRRTTRTARRRQAKARNGLED